MLMQNFGGTTKSFMVFSKNAYGGWPLIKGSSENSDTVEQKHHFILTQTHKGSSLSGPQSLVTFDLALYFPQSYS